MDIDAVVSLISSVGFPIVVSGALFWQLNRQAEMHKEEMNSLKEAIEELKVAIVQMTTSLNNRNI